MLESDWNGQPDLQDDLVRDLSGKKARLLTRFNKIEGSIEDMKGKIEQIKQKINQLKNLKATKCPERKVLLFFNIRLDSIQCKCENGYTWSDDEKKCVCEKPNIIEDGQCIQYFPPLEERYDVENVLILGTGF